MPGRDGLGFLVILNKSSELRFELRRSELIFRTWARPVQFVDCGIRTRVVWVSELRADDGRTVSIEKLCLSLLVSKVIKKVIKVSYLNEESRQCFVFFGYLCVWTLWTFYACEYFGRTLQEFQKDQQGALPELSNYTISRILRSVKVYSPTPSKTFLFRIQSREISSTFAHNYLMEPVWFWHKIYGLTDVGPIWDHEKITRNIV